MDSIQEEESLHDEMIELVADDGEGGGNFLINDRGEGAGKYIYITVTDKALLLEGEWTVSVTSNGVTVSDFAVNGVDDIPELERNGCVKNATLMDYPRGVWQNMTDPT